MIMKITDVKTIRLRATIPTEGQVFSRSGVRGSRSTTLVQIETDRGIIGLGSCSGNGELIEVIIDKVLKPLLIGMDPTEIDEIWDKAYVRGGHKEFGTRGIGVVALSGIDIALWDILGQVRGVPIYEVLGGKCRDNVPVYATALYPEEPSKVAKRARAFAEKGFHGVKIKVGFDLDQDARIVRAVCEELGRDFTIMTDANQGYSVDVGLKAAEAFSYLDVFWLEEPLFAEDIEGHACLREKGKVPIAVGENLHTYHAFENFVARGAVDFLQPDVARAGGITEIRKIASLAAKHNLTVSFHTWGDAVALAASLHLSAAVKECGVMELDYTYNPLREELLKASLEVKNGFMTPPDKPGLGVELDPKALDRFAFSGSEEIALRQRTLKPV
ncbi:MAG TPA: mandelate racemase/muconate lactonizing enzyme family protein [Candidatus Binatia bacterium]|nr:mandelate racemase/muconate lactonizing enzyme family protein [Candidatus Binatia bacterium]